jgi:hypothetical protein
MGASSIPEDNTQENKTLFYLGFSFFICFKQKLH